MDASYSTERNQKEGAKRWELGISASSTSGEEKEFTGKEKSAILEENQGRKQICQDIE